MRVSLKDSARASPVRSCAWKLAALCQTRLGHEDLSPLDLAAPRLVVASSPSPHYYGHLGPNSPPVGAP
ncbi:hypothetical protein Y1Q_0017363 [Alligator mississippiensis]|uniref:Uncharacterized protein n=1 Tax=Alligator mississippiensis TaxID=8496 RepID=A0A151NGH3_ALLMI|nr:hypothetical protein Y1Q_0017363 [Alligator mississippiensis]